ncbi:hypothetical protein BJF88_04680 [Cellulosimicrobium sp. CUA-896]|nr:hypothetical protein BJF88_04680 [Cellulosimicrobium sp. CUA-896]
MAPAYLFDFTYSTGCGMPAATAASWSACVMWPSSSMRFSVRSQRCCACSGLFAGSQLVGLGMMPAMTADSDSVSSAAGLA